MSIFVELGLILLITTVISLIVRLLRQPLAVGYILSGIIVGPYVLNILHSHQQIELFSKLGISILLFIVGLSLNPETIKETAKSSLVTGIGQILFTALVGFIVIEIMGYDNMTSFYIAIALTFSSTIIVLKILSDRGDMGKLYGKLSVGLLLVQDLAATMLLIVLPLIGVKEAIGSQSMFSIFLTLFLKGVGCGLILYFIAKKVLPKVLDSVARSQELLLLFSITWGLVLSAVFLKLGFSIEVGALVAGITFSASSYAYEISSRMRPLRDFFIVLFFIMLGSQVAIADMGNILLPSLILVFFVLIGNPLIVFVIMNILGHKRRVAFMAGLTMGQVSEFSLILVAMGYSLGHINQTAVSIVTLVAIMSISISAYMIMYSEKVYNILMPLFKYFEFRKQSSLKKEFGEKEYEMIIFGYGRVGYEFVQTAKSTNSTYLVVDFNPETVKYLRGKDVNFIYGDAEDVEFLDEIKLCKAKTVISTIPDTHINMLLIRQYRKSNSDGTIIVTGHNISETKKFYEEGATYVIMPHYLGAHLAADMILDHIKKPGVFEKARNKQLSDISIQIHKAL